MGTLAQFGAENKSAGGLGGVCTLALAEPLSPSTCSASQLSQWKPPLVPSLRRQAYLRKERGGVGEERRGEERRGESFRETQTERDSETEPQR